MESQARVRQLLLTNRDLLQHMSLLVRQIKELEIRSEQNRAGDSPSLQNLALNLKNLYSLEINLPSTSTPAPMHGRTAPVRTMGESYLNRLNMEKDVVTRRVGGSEVTPGQRADEDRLLSSILKLIPPPPAIARKRLSKIFPAQVVESKSSESISHNTPTSVTTITSCSITPAPLHPQGGSTQSFNNSCFPVFENGDLSPIKERSSHQERGGDHGTFHSITSSYDNLEDTVTIVPDGVTEHWSLENTLPFSTANDTCLHISFSEDDCPDVDSDHVISHKPWRLIKNGN
ncbi:uncharacterized protein LOC142731721 [Rhinoderma darwinii]|uniref:uncharacterized protein LOC142731721 n=1 Tax=Rhinoderma darwinii TaxID=43563 RepID=UPI003F67804E